MLTVRGTVCDKMLVTNISYQHCWDLNVCEYGLNDCVFYGFVVKDEGSSSFSIDQSVTLSEIVPTVTEPTSPPRATSTSAALSDFIQSTPTVNVDLKVRSLCFFRLISINVNL